MILTCASLKSLDISGIDLVSDELVVEIMCNLNGLEYLNISGCYVDLEKLESSQRDGLFVEASTPLLGIMP